MINAVDLTKNYGRRPGVEGITFTIQEHEIVGLLGPNGAGKSTIMKMLAGYQLPTAGTIEIDGRNILKLMEENISYVGFMPENPPLYTEMGVEKLLDFTASVKGIKKTVRRAHVEEIMELTNITQVKERIVGNLSKGYRQRVGMAQALVGLPGIIILDEPTVGMDPAQIHEVRKLLLKLKEQHTIIISSHILAEIAQVCDRVLVIDDGHLVMEETMESLRQRQTENAGFLLRTTADPEVVRLCLMALDGVEAVTEREADSYEVTVRTGMELRSRAVEALVHEGIPVIELKGLGQSLEEVFLKLTGTGKV